MFDQEDEGTRIGVVTALAITVLVLFGLIAGLVIRQLGGKSPTGAAVAQASAGGVGAAAAAATTLAGAAAAGGGAVEGAGSGTGAAGNADAGAGAAGSADAGAAAGAGSGTGMGAGAGAGETTGTSAGGAGSTAAAGAAPGGDIALLDEPIAGETVGVLYFGLDSATLPAAAAAELAKAQAALAAAGGKRLVLSGFHDPSGDAAHNADLAKRRAIAVRDALVAQGVDAARVGLRKPEVTTGGGPAEQARRVEIRIAD